MAAIFRECGMGSVYGWSMGILSKPGLRLGISVSVGMDSVSHRKLDVHSGARLGMAAGRSWMGVNTRPRLLNAPANFSAPRPPASIGQSLVVVNRGPSVTFAGRSTSKLIIQNNSASLGIPRGGLNDLSRVSGRVSSSGNGYSQNSHSAGTDRTPVDATVFVIGVRITRSDIIFIAVAGGARERRANKFWRGMHSAPAGRGPSKN